MTCIETYRKPHSIIDYISPKSAHRPATSIGIMHTELTRILITDPGMRGFAKHTVICMKALQRSGHDLHKFVEVLQRYPHQRRAELLSRRRQRQRLRKQLHEVGYTVKYVKGLEDTRFSIANRAAKYTLSKLCKYPVRVATRYTVGRHIFRIRYRHMW